MCSFLRTEHCYLFWFFVSGEGREEWAGVQIKMTNFQHLYIPLRGTLQVFLNIITEVSETYSNVQISKGKGHNAVLGENYPPDDLLIRE